ncbi:HNH endonuclease signature motif containing protein [Methylorubrum thiocyanatum]
MVLSLPDTKLLWGRAAARCSRDGCGVDLTRSLQGQHYILGEQAHMTGQSPAGPRPIEQGGPDTYENMILLCPTCHTEIDKKPVLFPKDMLLAWKKKHEEEVAAYGSERHFSSTEELSSAIRGILDESRAFFDEYGPKSKIAESNPSSNTYEVWEIGRAARLVPNNLRIINTIKANADLLTPEQKAAVPAFIAHADGFAHHVHQRLDHYPLFPSVFREAFR